MNRDERLRRLLRYVMEHPFREQCLSKKQIKEVVRLQEVTTTDNAHLVRGIYNEAASSRVFQYLKVFYFKHIDDSIVLDNRSVVALVFTEDDYNIICPKGENQQRFERIANYYGFPDLQLGYISEDEFKMYRHQFQTETIYEYFPL
jgi:hypothetical protein